MSRGLLHLALSPVKFRLFLFRKLPAAFFAGIRVRTATETACTVSVPYRWSTQNPFRSTYFACLAMAAEMSTGLLALNAVWGRKPAVSLLVVSLESVFHKKAVEPVYFQCADGRLLQQAAADAIASGAGQSVKVYSRGATAGGELVAEFWITWSFKAKQPKQ